MVLDANSYSHFDNPHGILVTLTALQLRTLHTRLLRWFDRHQRDLPWRADRDAYRIWVSEVMLQQTTVAAVVPYFERFMAAFPNVAALAAAEEQQVLKVWEGLGYYRRARHLHFAARLLVGFQGTTLQDDPAMWAMMPGVGPYILGAVLSQAFERRLPIVEANSLRVLARLFGYRGDPREGEGKAWVWAAAESLLPVTRVGDYNQALMELGALVCTPTAPKCETCPLKAVCEARRLGLQAQIPPPKKAKAIVAVQEVGIVIRKADRILLCRRQANSGRWQNMWEVPHGPIRKGESVEEAAERVARVLTRFIVKVGSVVATIRHSVTHHAITMTCLDATLQHGRFASQQYAEKKWLSMDELTEYPVSSPQRELMRKLAEAQDTTG